MHDSAKVSIAVVSDLHAYDDPDATGTIPSHLCVKDPEVEPTKHPIVGLLKLIKDDLLQADLLLCAGDLADKARPAALKYAWQKAHSLARALKAPIIAATTGNHDVDSHYIYNKFDAKGVLQALTPPFPLSQPALCDKYWSRNFVIIEKPPLRLAVLNTAAFHGTGSEEYKHGRISPYTLDAFEAELQGCPIMPVNILLCHHHPQQHQELDLGDYDVMKNGQLLIDTLGKGTYGRWIIIHGHKHHPKLTYAAGSSSSPVVFSAGSLCAQLYLQLQTRARNQFYIITLPYKTFATLGLVGTIAAWDWATGIGWNKAQKTPGLPWQSGFGCRTDPALLATQVAPRISTVSEWRTVLQSHPELEYLLPQDLVLLFEALKRDHNIHVVEDSQGVPLQIGLRT